MGKTPVGLKVILAILVVVCSVFGMALLACLLWFPEKFIVYLAAHPIKTVLMVLVTLFIILKGLFELIQINTLKNFNSDYLLDPIKNKINKFVHKKTNLLQERIDAQNLYKKVELTKKINKKPIL